MVSAWKRHNNRSKSRSGQHAGTDHFMNAATAGTTFNLYKRAQLHRSRKSFSSSWLKKLVEKKTQSSSVEAAVLWPGSAHWERWFVPVRMGVKGRGEKNHQETECWLTGVGVGRPQ